jgi:anti-sigma B factor antagonist
MDKSEFIKRVVNDEIIVIDPGKTMDNNNAHEMVDLISDAQEEGYKLIILNMEKLRFLSSAGVGSILGTIETSREAGGDIVLCNVSDNIIHILKVLDLADYLTIKQNEQKAISLCGIEV